MSFDDSKYRPLNFNGKTYTGILVHEMDLEEGSKFMVKLAFIKEHLEQLKEVCSENLDFESQLQWMQIYADQADGNTRTLLDNDFAPLSFAILRQSQREGAWLNGINGGLIYHGPHDGFGNGSAPSFSVSLSDKQGWSIHT